MNEIVSETSSTLETRDCGIFSICLVTFNKVVILEEKNCVFIDYYSLAVRIYFIIQRLLADFIIIIEYYNIMFFTFNFQDTKINYDV